MQTILVPASLDLVERARLGLNGLTGSLDPALDYEPYFLTFLNAKPAYMVHWSSLVSGVLPKYLEAIPLLRCMSGDGTGADIEQGMLEAILANIHQDGLIYDCRCPEGSRKLILEQLLMRKKFRSGCQSCVENEIDFAARHTSWRTKNRSFRTSLEVVE